MLMCLPVILQPGCSSDPPGQLSNPHCYQPLKFYEVFDESASSHAPHQPNICMTLESLQNAFDSPNFHPSYHYCHLFRRENTGYMTYPCLQPVNNIYHRLHLDIMQDFLKSSLSNRLAYISDIYPHIKSYATQRIWLKCSGF